MQHTDIREIAGGVIPVGATVTVCGWVRTARDSKNMAFIELNDGTTLKHMQIVVDKAALTPPAAATHLGAALRVVGTVVEAQNGRGVEINASAIDVLGDCPADYPLQKKFQKLETLREAPHLRVRTNTFNAVFRVRSVMAAAIHRFFQERGYVYVNTPLITGSDCEGAGEMFQVTTIGYSDKYHSREEYYANDFFGRGSPSRGSSRARSRRPRSGKSTRSVRVSVPRTAIPPATWRNSGTSSRKWRSPSCRTSSRSPRR